MTQADYASRFDAVLAHIEANLDGDLSVERLSQVAHFSPFHFHRQFSAYMGIPVARYVQLMRLRKAAHRLASRTSCTVLDVALDSGFDSPEAFSRAFRRAFGVAPATFRRQPNWQYWNAVFLVPHFLRSIIMQVQITTFTETRVAALQHCGPASLVNASVNKFIQWRKQSGQSPVATSRTFGIPHSNPDTTPPQDFRFDICGEIRESLTPNDAGVREAIIPGGRYAVVRHVGPTDYIGETLYPVYRDWLPASGEELRDQPLFFQYLSVYPQTPEDQWQTDIFIPLKDSNP